MKKIRCVIISGPDNCGKDTAVSQLKALVQNELGKYPACISSKFSKLVKDWPGEMKMLKAFVEDFIDSASEESVLVLNRSWFDEDVYGPLYRNYGESDNDWLYDLEDRHRDSIMFVLLDDTPANLAAREDGLSFSNGLLNVISAEREKFIGIYQKVVSSGMPHLYVNVAKVKPEEMGSTVFAEVKDKL